MILVSLYATIALIVGGCGDSSGAELTNSLPQTTTSTAEGAEVPIPAGWFQVSLDAGGFSGLRGHVIQIASVPIDGTVTDICTPGRILDQLPTGEALVRTSITASLDRYTKFSPPFTLGSDSPHECGESHLAYLDLGDDALRLEVWSDGLRPEVRSQIEHMVDGIIETRSGLSAAPFADFHRCPAGSADSANAGSWMGSVAGITCREAGKLIQTQFAARCACRGGSTTEGIRQAGPARFRATGYECSSFPLPDGDGWHVICADPTSQVSFFSTP